jgi:hypothetical protein
MMREAAKDARICSRVSSFTDDSDGQLRIWVIRCAEATVGKVASAMKSVVMASAVRLLGWRVHDTREEKHVRYQQAVAPGP